MAIIKELDTKFGVSASYHRITAFNISYKHKKVLICVGTYSSKESRRNMCEPLEEVDIEVPYSDYLRFTDVNPIEEAYHWLKENVIGFEDAIDDMDVLEPYQAELIQDE